LFDGMRHTTYGVWLGGRAPLLLSVGLAVRPAAGPSLCNERPQKPNDHDLHAGRRRRHDRPGAYGWLARDHQAVAKSLRKRWRSSRIVQRLRQTHAPEAIFLQGAPATRQSDGGSPRTTAVAARARWRGTECTSWHCGTLDWRSLREPTSAQRHLRRRRPADWRSSSASSPGRAIAGRLGDLFSRRSGRRARRPK
jgi:hypothetical protein